VRDITNVVCCTLALTHAGENCEMPKICAISDDDDARVKYFSE